MTLIQIIKINLFIKYILLKILLIQLEKKFVFNIKSFFLFIEFEFLKY